MKLGILDILIGLVVLLIVGTIGVGVYYTVISPEKPSPTTPPLTVKGRSVDFESKDCPLTLKHPNTWGADEVDGGKEITLQRNEYKVVITCEVTGEKGDISAKAFQVETLTVSAQNYVRYVFFSDEEVTKIIGGYIVPDDKNLKEDATAGYKYTGDLFITVANINYSIKYLFPEGTRSTSEDGIKAYDEYLGEMDTIVESITFK